MLEVPFYVALMWLLIPTFGITGVAAAWSLRCMLDAIALCGAAESMLPPPAGAIPDGDAARPALPRGSPLRQRLGRYAGTGGRVRARREPDPQYRERPIEVAPPNPIDPGD